ncbi:tetratricopeptide repeat protein [Ekhidna sp.]|uniref:tetratricopeptide repeat protein n=1 Tax=Ekhidna sp. TaxID=2608089 RepID=UPI003B5023F4
MKQCLNIAAFCICLFTLGQTQELDSLKLKIKEGEPDSTKALAFLRIGFLYYQISPDSLVKYTTLGDELSTQIGFERGNANALNNLGTLEYSQSNFDKALGYYTEFLEISEKIGDLNGVNRALNNIGIVKRIRGDFAGALSSYEQSLNVKDKLGDIEGKGGTYNNMGMVYQDLGSYTKALECYFKSIEIKEQIGDEDAFASTYSNIGDMYKESGKYDLAMDYYKRALDIHVKYNETLGVGAASRKIGTVYFLLEEKDEALAYFDKGLSISNTLGNRILKANLKNDIGKVYFSEGLYDEALAHFSEAYHLFDEIGYNVGIIENLISVANYYLQFGQFKEAVDHAKEALEVSQILEFRKGMSDASKLLYEAHSKINDYKSAYEFSLLHKVYYDSLNAEIQSRELAIFESRFQLEKMSTENEMLTNQNRLNQATIERNKLQIQRQNLIIFGGSFMFLLSLSAIYIGYRYYQSRKRSLELLERKNHEITLQAKVLTEQADELIKVNEEIQRMNESLEGKVKKRTVEIQAQNEKLKEYAYSNAHHVRAPLARILGIADQLTSNGNISETQRGELISSLLDSAIELDQVIRRVSQVLSDEEMNT